MKKFIFTLLIATISLCVFSQQKEYSKDIAKVEQYSGVYVFTDCSPISEYEVLGEVANDKSSGTKIIVGFSTISLPPQYTDIREDLIKKAVLANRQVEGIIIKINREGEGVAQMIKFTNDSEDHSLARVNQHLGVLVFTDCKPVLDYTYIGHIKKIGGNNSDYNMLRDRLIKKCQKQFKDFDGVMPHLVSNGIDTGEAIAF